MKVDAHLFIHNISRDFRKFQETCNIACKMANGEENAVARVQVRAPSVLDAGISTVSEGRYHS